MRPVELKVGYVLELEERTDGVSFVMILPNQSEELVISGPKEWFPLKCFDDNLEYMDTRVLKVYGYSYNSQAYNLSSIGRELLWERTLPKRLTKAQIEQELGYPIEIVDESEA